MRESRFIAQNREKWAELEEMLQQKDYDADRLSELFVQVSDDLSYARTFYANRSVRVYLNGLTQQVFGLLYRFRRNQASKFVTFWTQSLPVAYWEGRRELSLAMFAFVLACLVGVVSQVYDPDFCRAILGDGYVDNTLDSIAKGDPMSVYKDDDAFGMFVRITVNNITVALFTFLAGIFSGIGTVFMMISNGVMLGCFQYFFFSQGVGVESLLTIWIHGTIEIASIVVAGGSGIVMGRGWLFPGTLTRLQAFRVSAILGMKMFLGTVPLFVIAGFAESYLTRHTDTPDIIRGLFILLCVVFCLGYYVLLPWRRRHLVNLHQRDLRLPADKPTVIDYHAIKTSSSLYLEGFTLVVKFSRAIYGSLFRTVLGVLTVAAILFWIYPSLFSEWLQPQLFEYDNDDTSSYFTVFWPQVVALGFVLVWPISRLWRSIAADADDQMGEQNAITYLGDTLLLFPLTLALAFWWVQFDDNMLSVFNFEGMYSWWWSLIAPFFLLLFYDAFIQRRFFVASIPSVWPLWTSAFGAGAGMCMLAYLAAFLISWLVNSFLLGFVFQFISLNLSLSPDGLRVFNQAIEFILDSLLLTTWVSILCGAFASWYYSRIEANDARGLIERIDQIGLTPQIQGLRRE